MGSYLTSALSSVGNAATNVATNVGQQAAASPIGQFVQDVGSQGVVPAVGNVAGNVGQMTGLGDVASGLQSLFGGGEAGRLADLGQAVPAGVELAGPSPTFTGGGFMQGVMDGFRGTMEQLPDIGGATQTGQGLGEFLAFLDRMNPRPGVGNQLQPIVNYQALMPQRATTMAPGYMPASEPRGTLTNLINGFTGGILAKPVGNATQSTIGFFPQAGR